MSEGIVAEKGQVMILVTGATGTVQAANAQLRSGWRRGGVVEPTRCFGRYSRVAVDGRRSGRQAGSCTVRGDRGISGWSTPLRRGVRVGGGERQSFGAGMDLPAVCGLRGQRFGLGAPDPGRRRSSRRLQ